MPDQPRKLGVLIATPLRKYAGPQDVPPQIAKALIELRESTDPEIRAEADKYVIEFAACLGGVIRARNAVTHEALKDKAVDFLCMWDADIFPGDPARALLRILSHRRPIAGGLYCRRGGKRPQYVVTWAPEAKVDEAGRVEVIELGGGGLKTYHRSVFEAVAKAFPKISFAQRESGERVAGFFQHVVIEGDELSEDYFLDFLCRKLHIPILADTRVLLGHGEPGKLYPEDLAWPPIPALEDGAEGVTVPPAGEGEAFPPGTRVWTTAGDGKEGIITDVMKASRRVEYHDGGWGWFSVGQLREVKP